MIHEPIRASLRRYVRLDVQVVRDFDFQLVGDLALDLSPRGMLVRSALPSAKAGKRVTPVFTGEEVVLAFKPPKSNKWFDAQGTVARVVHGRRPGDYGLSYGIEFHNLSANDEQRLFDDLRGTGRPDAQRPPRPLA